MKVKLIKSYTCNDGTVLPKGKELDAYAMDNGQYAVKFSKDGRVILSTNYVKEVK